MTERQAYIAFNLTEKVGPATLEKLMAQIHLKWKDREGFSQQNEQLFDDLRHLAMCNAELAYSVIGKDWEIGPFFHFN